MPAIEVILLIGAIVLACGCAGLMCVRLTNPMLKGLGWLAAAYASGAAASIFLLLWSNGPRMISVALTDVLVLLPFVLVHVATLNLFANRPIFPTFGVVLLSLQAAIGLYLVFGGVHPHGIRIIVSGLLVAAQAGQTAGVLFRDRDHAIRISARFSAIILFVFMLANATRSFATAFGLLNNAQLAHDVTAAMFTLFIAVALGVAFGQFWMATTMLTTGLEHMASTDPLTRIYNRRMFLMWCERELARSRGNEAPFSILMVDLDRFKQINDKYGHSVGDLALCAAVEQMQDSVRGIDILGRWGGEEFSVLLPRANDEAALVVAERVRANIARILLPAPGARAEERARMIQFTASVGVTTFRGGTDDVTSMLQRADACLYRAKASGRNLVLASSDAPEVRAAEFAMEPIEASLGRLSHLVQ